MNDSKKSLSATFDAFAEDYDTVHRKNLGVLGKDLDVFARYKVQLTAELLPTPPKTIFEFGCGTGKNLPFFHQFFPSATITACDISNSSLQKAQERIPGLICFNSSSPETLTPYRETFDVVFLSCVLHHISLQERQIWIKALTSTIKKDGALVIFEHNPWNPATRYLVSTCPFDKGVTLVQPNACIELLQENGMYTEPIRYTLLFPWRHAALLAVEKFFSHVPLGGQYCVVARKLVNS